MSRQGHQLSASRSWQSAGEARQQREAEGLEMILAKHSVFETPAAVDLRLTLRGRIQEKQERPSFDMSRDFEATNGDKRKLSAAWRCWISIHDERGLKRHNHSLWRELFEASSMLPPD